MPDAGVALVAHELLRQRLDELLDPGDRRAGIVRAGENQRRTTDVRSFSAKVEVALAAPIPIGGLRRVHRDPRDDVRRDPAPRVERHADPHVLGERRLGRVGEVPRRDLAGLWPAEPVELRDHASVAVTGDGADENEPLDALRLPGGVEQRDEAADARAEQTGRCSSSVSQKPTRSSTQVSSVQCSSELQSLRPDPRRSR